MWVGRALMHWVSKLYVCLCINITLVIILNTVVLKMTVLLGHMIVYKQIWRLCNVDVLHADSGLTTIT